MLARDPRVGEDEAGCRGDRPRSSGVPSTSIVRSVPSGDADAEHARGSRAAPAGGTPGSASRRRGCPARPARAGLGAAPGGSRTPARSGSIASTIGLRRPAPAGAVRRSTRRRRSTDGAATCRAHGTGRRRRAGSPGAAAARRRPGPRPRRPRPARARATGRRPATTTGRAGQVVGMGAGERQRRVGEAAGERDGVRRLRPRARVRSVGLQPHAVAPRDDRPRALSRSGALHRPLHAALELHRLDAGAEQRGAGALEDAFEEALDVGEEGHGDGNRTRGRRPRSRRRRAVRGTIGLARRSGARDQRRSIGVPRSGGPLRAWLYSGTCPAGLDRASRSDVCPGNTMTEILTESFCERCGTRYTFESSAPRRSRVGRVRTLARA